MRTRNNSSSGRSRDERPKRAFSGKKSFGDKPAFKKKYNDDSFSKDKDDKRSFRPSPSTRDSRSDDGERKPFRRPESKFGERRREDSKPFNSRNHTRPERKSEDDTRTPRAPYSREARPDDRERKPFQRPEGRFGDDRRRNDSRPSTEGRDRRSDDRPERTSGETRAPRAPYSRDARSGDRDSKPFRRPESKFGEGRRRDDSKPPFERRTTKFGDESRAPRAPREARPGDGDKKWNRKSDSEFYGDRRKPSFRGRGFAKKSFGATAKEDDGTIRLNKFISNAGICSRREADELITAGVVSVNGKVMTELGYKVKPDDVVRYNDEPLKSERMVYILLNKPKDFITTSDDPEKRKTVMGLIVNACKERVYPVGRLDRNTTGLLLLTNDGDLTRKLTHPSFEVQKIYQVELDRALKPSDMDAIEKGINLNDGFIKVDAINYITGQEKSLVGVEIHSGRNRIVRRIFEHFEYEVKKLDRVYFAGLSKKDLARGRWRFLTEMELASLKMITGNKKFKNLAPDKSELVAE